MITREVLSRAEINYFRRFSNVEEPTYGLLFHNTDNRQSHDSNHAVVYDLHGPVARHVEHLVAFYQSKCLPPRVYPAYQEGELDVLAPVLTAKGFQFMPGLEEGRFFVWEGRSRIEPLAALDIRRVTTWDASVAALVNSEGGAPWSVGVLQRQLPMGSFVLLVGYVDSTAVTMASIAVMDEVATVGDVLTHPGHRGRGYARALIHHLVSTYPRLSRKPLYLVACNPSAIRIYEEAGFVEQHLGMRCWSAYLP